VPADGRVGEAVEPDLPYFSTYSHFTAKDPVAIADGMEIFRLSGNFRKSPKMLWSWSAVKVVAG